MAQRPPSNDTTRPPEGEVRPGTERPLDLTDLLIGMAVGAVCFGVYFVTLAPGLLRGTSGEFQTLAASPGYAHPAGSPLYVLLTQLAALGPDGDVARSVNLLSAIAGAVAIGFLYLLARSLVGRRWICVAGAAALAVSPAFWSQAILAGPYVLATGVTVAVLLAACVWQRTGRWRWLFAAVWLTAMGLGVHAGVVLTAPALLVLVLFTPRQWIASLAATGAGAAVGLVFLLAAFWVIDRSDRPTSYFRTVIGPSRSVWGLEADGLDQFHERVRLCLAPPQYRDSLLSGPPAAIRQKTIEYFANLLREFPPAWPALALGGLVWLSRRSWKMALMLLVAFAAHLGFDLAYDSQEVHLLYVATYVPIALLGACGLALVGDAWTTLTSRKVSSRRSPPATDAILGVLGLAVVVSPMWFSAAWNDEGRRDCWVPPEGEPFRVGYSASFHREVRSLVDDLEDNAVLFVGWAELYPCYYVGHIEQGRTELVFFCDYPQPYHFELADSALEYVRHTAASRPVYFTHVVDKVDRYFELRPVRRGRQTLYRVGPAKGAAAVNDG